jgi:hypothetical protein
MKIPGVGPETPTVTNEKGGKQSDTPYGLNLIPPLAILAESKVLKTGAEKYGEGNWKKIEIKDHLNHALQHIYAYLAGDRSDNHLANLACRAHFALELEEEEKTKPVPLICSVCKLGLFPDGPKTKLSFKTESYICDVCDGKACIDCKFPLGSMYFGAGDGTGQKFRCQKCHEAYQNIEKPSF